MTGYNPDRHFHIQTDNGEVHHFERNLHTGHWRVTKVVGRRYHFDRLEFSSCRRYAVLRGWDFSPKYDSTRVLWVIACTGLTGQKIAARLGDNDPWIFSDGSQTSIAADYVSIANPALLAATKVAELPLSLTRLLGLKSQALCSHELAKEISGSDRFALLRDFAFKVTTPTGPIGTGRRAENRVRHENSNYDAMLDRAGGLLTPDQYAVVRLGVDRLVRETLRRAKP